MSDFRVILFGALGSMAIAACITFFDRWFARRREARYYAERLRAQAKAESVEALFERVDAGLAAEAERLAESRRIRAKLVSDMRAIRARYGEERFADALRHAGIDSYQHVEFSGETHPYRYSRGGVEVTEADL